MANPDGTPIWFELTTGDQDAAGDFCRAVFGWSIAPSPMAEHGGYRIASAPDGEGIAGLMAAEGGMPTGWLIYFGVADVDAAAARIAELGGAIHMGPQDIPHVGRFAYATDPQGVGFYIMRGASPEDSTAFKQMAGEAGVGHGVWVELATPDPDAALAFYGALFGWAKQGAMPMGDMGDYTFIGRHADDRPGAMMSSTATGAPPRWTMYFQVSDIDAAIAAAQAEGGALLQGPDEIPGGSFSASIADAAGLPVGVVGPRAKGA